MAANKIDEDRNTRQREGEARTLEEEAASWRERRREPRRWNRAEGEGGERRRRHERVEGKGQREWIRGGEERGVEGIKEKELEREEINR